MDALKLNDRAVDQLLPLINDIGMTLSNCLLVFFSISLIDQMLNLSIFYMSVSLLRKVKGIHNKEGSDFDGISTMKPWMEKLENSKASDEISEDEARQLIFDLEKSYGAFHSFLGS